MWATIAVITTFSRRNRALFARTHNAPLRTFADRDCDSLSPGSGDESGGLCGETELTLIWGSSTQEEAKECNFRTWKAAKKWQLWRTPTTSIRRDDIVVDAFFEI